MLNFAFSVSLATQVGLTLKDIAILVSPLSGDESMCEDTFDDSKVYQNHAASSMRLVIFPIAFIQARRCNTDAYSEAMPFAILVPFAAILIT